MENTAESNAAEAPIQAISQFSQSLAQAAQSHRTLWTEMAGYAKDESLRFTNLRLDRTSQAVEKLSTVTGVAGLMSLQQEWLRDLMQDYAGHNMRLVGAWRDVAHTVVSEATDAAGETADRMKAHAADMMQQGEEMAQQAQDTAHEGVEQMSSLNRDINNNFVQH